MKDVDTIKLNPECLKCQKFKENSGECNGRRNLKANCLAFTENLRGGTYGQRYSTRDSY